MAGISAMEAFGDLICRLNPYTERTDLTSPHVTGKMDVFLAATYTDPSNPGDSPLSQVQLQIDAKYAASWTFKGQPQNVNTAVRIKYRYPVYPDAAHTTPADVLYWVEDYVLIGYEGAGGN
jgi:hypothetical protein